MPAEPSETRFDKNLRWVKDRPWLAILLLMGVAVVALGQITGAIDSILSFAEKHIARQASREGPDVPKSPGSEASRNPPRRIPNSASPKVDTTEDQLAREEAQIAAADDAYSPMSMDEFFSEWYGKETTALQRDELERRLVGHRVIWTGVIHSIEPGHTEGTVRMIVNPANNSFHSSFLDFGEQYRAELLRLEEGQTIRFTGVVRSFVASPFLEDCKVLRVIGVAAAQSVK